MRSDRQIAERLLLYLIRASLALALATPLVSLGGWLPDSIFPHAVGKALYIRLCTEIAFAAWLTLIIRFPAYRLPRSWLLAALLVYLAVGLVASITGVSLTRSIWSDYERMGGWIELAHLTAFALMTASTLRTIRHWETMLNANLLVGLVLGLMGLYEIAAGWGNRLELTFGNPAFLASYALVNCLAAAAFLARSLLAPGTGTFPDSAGTDGAPGTGESLMRSFWVAVICLNLLLLSQSGTRGAALGLVAAILSVLVMGVFWSERRNIRKVCIGAIAGAIAIGAALVLLRSTPIVVSSGSLSPTLERFTGLTPDAYAVRSRLSAIRYGLEAFADRPLLGWGPENFNAAYDAHVDGEAAAGLYRFDRAHNSVVEELVTAGILGLLAFCALWFILGRTLLSRIRALPFDSRVFVAILAAALVGHFVQNLFLFDTPAASLQFHLLVGFTLWLAGKPLSSALVDEPAPGKARSHGVRFLRSPAALAIATCLSLAAFAVVFHTLTVRTHLGATATHSALSGSHTGERRFALYESAFSSAPWYSAETVRRFSLELADNWDELSDSERRRALEIIERDAESVIAREPRNWLLHLGVSELYIRASQDDPSFIARTRAHIDRVTEIAPGRFETLRANVRQHILEGNHDEALALLDDYAERSESYLPMDSNAYRSLEWMRAAADQGR